MNWGSIRGASSPLGTLLMVALTVVLVGATGAVVFDAVPNLGEQAPSASVDASAESSPDAERLVLAHDGGDELDVAEFDVVVRDDGTTTRMPLSAFDNRTGTTGGRIDAGDVLRTPFLLDGPTTVSLVHVPSGSVVVERSVALPETSSDVIDMEDSDPTQSFESGQDGTGETTVEAGGATVSMEGNQWKYVNRTHDVTEDTMLVFEFNSTAEGEIHGIGLEDDQDQTGSRVVKLYGTQNWGEPVNQFADADTYSVGDGWVRYEIPIGELYDDNGVGLAETDYLVFVMDCDTNSGCDPTSTPPPNSQFRNVRVYEASSSPVVVAASHGPGVNRATNATTPSVLLG